MGAKIRISFGFCILLVLLILMLPLPWCIGALLAALVHEAFHITAVLLCGGDILDITVTGVGAKIEMLPMSSGKQAFCALAGPAGSFFCLAASEYFPELSVCGLVQGAYNLLPVYPLDGGRALGCVCSGPVCRGIECFTMIVLCGFYLWLTVHGYISACFLLISVCYTMIQRKISCKEGNLAVQ